MAQEPIAEFPTTGSTSSGVPSVAPVWHTLVVLVVMLGVSVLGAHVHLPTAYSVFGRAPSYLPVMVIEWGSVAFIAWERHRRGTTLSALIGGDWASPLFVLRDLGIGIAFLVIAGGALHLLTMLLKVNPTPAMLAMLPHTPFEKAVWVLLSMTGGFCEEVIFRGYLQSQFASFTRSVAMGIVLQGFVFGLSHGYQGWRMMALIAVYGVCFGLLARWRRNLRPGMLGHALQDTLGGFFS